MAEEKLVRVKITKKTVAGGVAYHPDGKGGLKTDSGSLKSDIVELKPFDARGVVGGGRGEFVDTPGKGPLTTKNAAGLVKTQSA